MEEEKVPKYPTTQNNSANNKLSSAAIQIVIGVIVGALLGYGGAMITITEKTARLEEQVAQLQKLTTGYPQHVETQLDISPAMQTSQDSIPIKPDELVDIIKQQQQKYVKRSCSTNAYECFTSDDLKEFKKRNIPNLVAAELRKDYKFLDLVKVIRLMKPADRQRLLELALNTSKRTWREIGYITCEGQTDDGHTAELSIASSIGSLVSNLVKLPINDFENLYR